VSEERHRGPHPKDRELFAAERVSVLREATFELSWLLGRGYVNPSALKLAGDRHALTARQRKAVERAAASDADVARRSAKRVRELDGCDVDVDAFNALIVGESLLSGAPVFRGRDGALRDLAGVHGSWRRVSETERVIELFVGELRVCKSVRWLVDSPISNSGRLAAMLRAHGHDVEVVSNPDRTLVDDRRVAATSDAWILDRCAAWCDLPARLAAGHASWIVDLS
jgi:hypothetical protein